MNEENPMKRLRKLILRFGALNKRGGEEAGEGKTVNMSSSGVLFTSVQTLRPGRRVASTPKAATPCGAHGGSTPGRRTSVQKYDVAMRMKS